METGWTMSNWHMASGLISLLCALALSVVVLHPKIHEGVIIKAGLIGIIIPCLVTFALTFSASQEMEAYWRAAFWMKAGLLAVCVGIVLKANKHRKRVPHEEMSRRWMRRMTEPVNDLAHFFNDEREKIK